MNKHLKVKFDLGMNDYSDIDDSKNISFEVNYKEIITRDQLVSISDKKILKTICVLLSKLCCVNEGMASIEIQGKHVLEKFSINENSTCGEARNIWNSLTREDNMICEQQYNVKISVNYNDKFMQINIFTSIEKILEQDINSLKSFFILIMENIINTPDKRIIDLCLMNTSEIQHYIYELNCTDKDISGKKFIDEEFVEHAKIIPEKIAVYDKKMKLTYKELNMASDTVASYLVKKGLQKGDYVPIVLKRSVYMIISALAVMKCGGVYVPISEKWPQNRILQIIEQLNCKYVIWEHDQSSDFLEDKGIICLDILKILHEENDNKKIYIKKNKDDLAYVIFTSGTTGLPKGVEITHNALINVIDWMNNTFRVSRNDTLFWVTSFCFDLSVYDIFGILAAGGTIRIASEEEIEDSYKLLEVICNEKITLWDSTPNIFNQIILHGENNLAEKKKTNLRYVFFSGDWIPVKLPGRIKNVFPNCCIVSLGGATEATIWSNYYIINEVNETWKSIPYGKPIQNARYYVLDKYMNPMPPLCEGDLYIGGECLAKGYLNQQELTKEKFMENPFLSGERIYKTGDLARIHKDGNIELLGRSDNQVKIRGFRVELNEIKTVLNRLPYITDSIVDVEENNTSLVAYVTVEHTLLQKEIGKKSDKWKEVFNSIYKNENRKENQYIGWNNSLNGEEISKSEMDDWLTDTLNRVKDLSPSDVLEIGCGTGLIFDGLIQDINSYEACDISEIAVQQLQQKLSCSSKEKKIHFFCADAVNFIDYVDQKYDTIILNSVVQYFPDISYLMNVIKSTIKCLKKDGSVFIGDVRNLDLQNEFNQYAGKIESTELLISPHFFLNLSNVFLEISYVEILRKNGIVHNELTDFRYDVILHTRQDIIEYKVEDLDIINIAEWDEKCLETISKGNVCALKGSQEQIDKFLEEKKDIFNIKIPVFVNSGITREMIVVALFNTSKWIITGNYTISIDSKEKYQLSKKVDMYEGANVIKKALEEILPYYMIPSRTIICDKFPITENGKIDYHKLRSEGVYCDVNYQPASSEIERALIQIFENVFSTQNIGVLTTFSDLGGHSLKAISLTLEIAKKFNVELTIKEIQEMASVKNIALLIQQKEKVEFVKKDTKTIYNAEMSQNQKRMFMLYKRFPMETSYNVIDINRFKGVLSEEKIRKTVYFLMKKIAILHTIFYEEKGKYMQQLLDNYDIPLSVFSCAENKIEEEIREFNTCFNLEERLPWKVGYWKQCNESFLVFVFHHIIMDGVSLGIFKQLFSEIYNDKAESIESSSYLEYAVWEKNNQKNRNEISVNKQYWKERLKDFPEQTILRPNNYSKKSNKECNVFYKLSPGILQRIESYSETMGVSVFSVFMASINLVLYKYTGNKDIVVGTVSSCRVNSDFAKTIGMFVNTLPHRSVIQNENTIDQFVKETNSNILEDILHQNCSYLDILAETSNVSSEMFSCMIAFQSMDDIKLSLEGIQGENLNYRTTSYKFNISFIINITKDIPNIEIEYNSMLYTKDYIDKLVGSVFKVLFTIVENKTIRIKDLFPNSKKKVAEQYNKLNNTENIKGLSIDIGDRLVLAFEKYKKKIAIADNDKNLTYAELKNMIGNFTKIIDTYDCSDSAVVAIYMKPCVELAVCQIATLISGKVFLTLDPTHPLDRNTYILKDSNAKILIFKESDKLHIPQLNIHYCDIEKIDSLDKDVHNCICNQDNDGYIIYTSGSTGVPKGVRISRKSLLNLCDWHIEQFNISEDDNATRYAGVSFDASIWELFPYLLVGATVYIIDESIKMNMEKLCNFFIEKRITVSFLPTPICEQFLQVEQPTDLQLRCMLTGGDKLQKYFPVNYDVYNNYGPSECTIVSTYYKVEKMTENIPIGRPIRNVNIYIVNADDQLCDIDIPGELLVAGQGVGNGYINESNNVNTFIHIPDISSKRLYRTGDIAVLREGGYIEYIGRKDNQIKLRGYRIEIGEIETQICLLDMVEKCAVIPIENNNNIQIVCFVKLKELMTTEMLREQLKTKLPYYMIPTEIIRIENIPLSANGKIDKAVLQEYYYSYKKEQFNVYEKPESYEEEILLKIWNDIFGKNVTLSTDFYSVGGNSISAMQIISKLYGYGYNADISDIYEFSTISSLAKHITVDVQIINQDCEIRENDDDSTIPLLPIQKWYFELEHSVDAHFNLTETIKIPENDFDFELFVMAVSNVVSRHGALRATFSQNVKNHWEQVIDKDDISHISIYNYEKIDMDNEKELGECIKNIQKKNSISSKVNISIGIFKAHSVYYIYFCIKHLVIDVFSFGIFIGEFKQAYRTIRNGGVPSKVKEKISIQQWCRKLETILDHDVNEYLKIWNSLPKVEIFEENVSKGNFYCLKKAKKIINLDKIKYITREYDTQIVLIAALGKCMQKVFDNDCYVINIENHGRDLELIKGDLSNSIGWYTVKYPILIRVSNNIEQLLDYVKEDYEKLKRIGVSYELLKYYGGFEINEQKMLSFNYLGNYFREEYVQKMEKLSSKYEGKHFYPIDLNCQICNGEFETVLAFNDAYITERIAETILEELYVSIEEIMHYIKQKYYTSEENICKMLNLEPFTRIFYKDCYLHAILAILKYYGASLDEIFCEDVCYYIEKKDGLFPIDIKYSKNISEKNVNELLGLKYIKTYTSENIIFDLLRAMDCNHPVIISVDCYFIPSRYEFYLKTHFPHVLIIKGYDKKENVFYVIEHENVDSSEFKEITIPFSDIEKAYYGAVNYFSGENIYTYYEFFGKLISVSKDFKKEYSKNIMDSFPQINNGIAFLKEWRTNILNYEKTDILFLEQCERAIIISNKIIKYKMVEAFVLNRFYSDLFITNETGIIIKGWNSVRKWFIKMKVCNSVMRADLNKLQILLDKIINAELKLYDKIDKYNINENTADNNPRVNQSDV